MALTTLQVFYDGQRHFSSLDAVRSCSLGIVVVVVVQVPTKEF
jgi:hypothetical protein